MTTPTIPPKSARTSRPRAPARGSASSRSSNLTVTRVRDFGGAFVDADRVVITDVYGAGEQPVPGVSGKLVADAVCDALPGRPVAYLPHRAELLSYLQTALRPGDALLTLGAGDISAVGEEVLADLRQRRS